MKEIKINEHHLMFDDNHNSLYHASEYLRDLPREESSKLFFKAKSGETAYFKDDHGVSLKLTRDGDSYIATFAE